MLCFVRPLSSLSLVSVALLSSCASTLPRDGGQIDDHETVKAKCGVGNYLYRAEYACKTAVATEVPRTAPRSDSPAKDSTANNSQAPKPQPAARLMGDKIEISDQVTFGTGNAVITPAGMKILDSVAEVIVSHSAQILKVHVEGHTDHHGNPDRNMALSIARAESVKDYLTKKGIDTEKLEAKGYGVTRPKFDPATATKAETAKNRRVEFTVETLSSAVH